MCIAVPMDYNFSIIESVARSQTKLCSEACMLSVSEMEASELYGSATQNTTNISWIDKYASFPQIWSHTMLCYCYVNKNT